MFVVDGQPTNSSENGKPVARRGHKANGSHGDGWAAGANGGRKMKKALVGFLAVALVAGMSVVVFANGSGVGIVGSPHDFSRNAAFGGKNAWNTRLEICRVCHVPHDHSKASQNYLNGLLWNHDVSTATYTMYSSAWSSTLTGTQSAKPDGTAKLCLGCHDGSVAIDAFDGHLGGATPYKITTYDAGFKVPGFTDGGNLDLRGTHPISIGFPASEIGDGKNFNDPASATWASGATVASTLDNGKVQCSTCHDVHDQESVAGTHLLRTAQKGAADGTGASGLCLACHIK